MVCEHITTVDRCGAVPACRQIDVDFDAGDEFICDLDPGTLFDVDFEAGTGVSDYEGLYEVTPMAYTEQVLLTENKRMKHDVTVHMVPYYETTNTHGTTVYIAEV